MEIQEVEIIIGKNGEVQVHVTGVKGQACLEITRGLEEALGGQVLNREMTAEALEQPEEVQNQLYNRTSKK
ncbi:MAG TPA: DUF2997 domain-containing protein [Anaerolineaceae bacterium]|nr:DUF2997 domain-containing protein [Anaerolineaceae bacterium]HPN50894.1 DUF2997 domain-containing protein [Anaerolineaceae bacterium]